MLLRVLYISFRWRSHMALRDVHLVPLAFAHGTPHAKYAERFRNNTPMNTKRSLRTFPSTDSGISYILYTIQKGLRRGGLTPACGSAHARNARGCRQTEAVNWTGTTATVLARGGNQSTFGRESFGPRQCTIRGSISAVDGSTFLFVLNGCGTLTLTLIKKPNKE